jgi:hypothetical protein
MSKTPPIIWGYRIGCSLCGFGMIIDEYDYHERRGRNAFAELDEDLREMGWTGQWSWGPDSEDKALCPDCSAKEETGR